MHQPRPYGLHAIGLPLTERDEAFIASVAKRITNLKELSKVDSMKMVYDLPDGGYVIVQDMGGNFRVVSHKPIHGKDPAFDGIATDYIPMLFSGVVVNAVVYENQPVELKLTEQSRFRLVNYKHLDSKPAKSVSLHRFRIGSDKKFSEFDQEPKGQVFWTQYQSLRPTWYSGAMSEVMQIVGGYGRQDFANLPDEKVNEFERARLIIPQQWIDKVNKELEGEIRLPAYTGLPPTDGTFQFDYRFNNTHAIGFDDNRKPWLLRVSASGVWAMPLPVVPATHTKAFRQYMELVGDDEIIAILDRFGAMPSGEAFPSGRDFEAWRRAGAIIKVCDSADFYKNIMYSSACGWSINSKGSEGYNTCYNYEDESGLAYGLTYKLSLKLAASIEYYGAKKVELVDKGPIADKVRAYLSQLLPTIGRLSSEDRAILYKLRRADSLMVYQRALGLTGDKDREYWHNLELKPIANHTGSVRQVYKGYLYSGAKFEYQPQIKFPEPLAGACLSFDFLPNLDHRYTGNPPNCDTIMFAYYVGDSLKTIKYFVDWGEFTKETEGNFELNMRIGNWEQTESFGISKAQGHFYSSDIDDREVVPDSMRITKLVGEDKGYDSKPFFQQDAAYWMRGTLWRNRYFTHKTNVKNIGSRSVDLAVCIPYYCRNATLQAKAVTENGVSTSESLQMYSVRDPYSYRYWTFDYILAWFNDDSLPMLGSPSPVDGSPVWVDHMQYWPTPENEFANNGDWIGGLPADYTWLIHPESGKWLGSGGGGAPSVGEYSTYTPATTERSGLVAISLNGAPRTIHKEVPAGGYYRSSPTPDGYYFIRDAISVVFGETKYSNTSESANEVSRTYWGSCSLVDHKSAHIFIGVINE